MLKQWQTVYNIVWGFADPGFNKLRVRLSLGNL